MTARFTTIGHSNHSMDDFLAMLRAAAVERLIDVRSFPRSRSNPAFNIDRLPDALAQAGIGYSHVPALGGRRAKQRTVDPGLNALWRVDSFHNYADYALGDRFSAAFQALVRPDHQERVVLMCAEAVWWRCHRRIITDYLLLNGHAVDHIMGLGHSVHAEPTPGAQRTPEGQVIYPGVPDRET